MNKKDKEKIELVITHCKMFLYGTNLPSSAIKTEPVIIADLYNNFALMHLISTMFFNS
jgi:hypothetical protein